MSAENLSVVRWGEPRELIDNIDLRHPLLVDGRPTECHMRLVVFGEDYPAVQVWDDEAGRELEAREISDGSLSPRRSVRLPEGMKLTNVTVRPEGIESTFRPIPPETDLEPASNWHRSLQINPQAQNLHLFTTSRTTLPGVDAQFGLTEKGGIPWAILRLHDAEGSGDELAFNFSPFGHADTITVCGGKIVSMVGIRPPKQFKNQPGRIDDPGHRYLRAAGDALGIGDRTTLDLGRTASEVVRHLNVQPEDFSIPELLVFQGS